MRLLYSALILILRISDSSGFSLTLPNNSNYRVLSSFEVDTTKSTHNSPKIVPNRRYLLYSTKSSEVDDEDDAENRFIAELQDLNEAFESVQESIRANSKLYEMKLAEYELESSQVRSQLAKKEFLLTEYQKQLEDQQLEYEKDKIFLKQKLEITKQELLTTTKQLDDLTSAARIDSLKLKADLTSTKEELTLSQAEKQRLEKQSAQWASERQELIQTQTVLKEALQDIKLKLAQVSEKAKADSTKQQQELKETTEILQNQLDLKEKKWKESISSLQQEKEEIWNKSKKLEKDLIEVASTSGDKDSLIQQLKQKVKSTTDEVELAKDALTKTLQQKEMDEKVWQEETKKLIQEKADLLQKFNSLEKSMKELQGKYSTVEQELNFVREALANAQKQNRQNEQAWKEEREALEQSKLDLELELEVLREKSEQELKALTAKFSKEREKLIKEKDAIALNLERSEKDLVQLSVKTDEERQSLQRRILDLETLVKETTEREAQLKKDFTELKAKANTGMIMDKMRVENENKMISTLSGKIVELEEERKSLRKLSSLGLKRVGSLLKFWGKSDVTTNKDDETNTTEQDVKEESGSNKDKSVDSATVAKNASMATTNSIKSKLFKSKDDSRSSFLSSEEKAAIKREVEATRRKALEVSGETTTASDNEAVTVDLKKKDKTQ